MKQTIKNTLRIPLQDFQLQQSLLDFIYREYEASVFKRLVAAGYNEVIAGPFKGLKFEFVESNKNFRTVHLLGMFETCLHKQVIKMAKRQHTIINIGCGTGYYTNGLARNLEGKQKNLKIIGYDIDSEQIKAAEKLKKHNQLRCVEHHNISSNHNYISLKGQAALAIIDIEGAEYNLLNEQKDNFINTDMLIEIHQTEDKSVDQGIKYLESLFADTHKAVVIKETKTIDLDRLNTIKDCLGNIAYIGLHLLTCENRPYPMKWLVLEKK